MDKGSEIGSSKLAHIDFVDVPRVMTEWFWVDGNFGLMMHFRVVTRALFFGFLVPDCTRKK